ncbi:MAG TPA: arginase family protein [Nitrososphaeraceae archaeon]|nr:arginase family protein [Nitrososphaeraceae archaeon]
MRYSNVINMKEANIVLLGVPDESKSKAPRKGTKNGPNQLRKALFLSENFKRSGQLIPICPMKGDLFTKKVFDLGNVKRDKLHFEISNIISQEKIPIIFGGDHSITNTTLKAIKTATKDKINLIYFDAHPDFVTSTRDYYGSVVSDSLDYIDIKKSIFVGIRACEPEEISNITKYRTNIIDPIDIQEYGVQKTLKKIMKTCINQNSNNIYISIDLDCLDPAFAPGVSVPTPCGLNPSQLIFFLKKIVEKTKIVGCDIVELSPSYDINDITANLAARLFKEILGSILIK